MPNAKDERLAALRGVPGALDAFAALPPSHQKRRLEAIGEA